MIGFFLPAFWSIYKLVLRVWYNNRFSYTNDESSPSTWSDFVFIAIVGMMAADLQHSFIDTFEDTRHCFPFVKPFKFFWIMVSWVAAVLRFIKNQAMKLVKPLMSAGKGASYYIKMAMDHTLKLLNKVYSAISEVVKKFSMALYTIIKGTLKAVWASVSGLLSFLF